MQCQNIFGHLRERIKVNKFHLNILYGYIAVIYFDKRHVACLCTNFFYALDQAYWRGGINTLISVCKNCKIPDLSYV